MNEKPKDRASRVTGACLDKIRETFYDGVNEGKLAKIGDCIEGTLLKEFEKEKASEKSKPAKTETPAALPPVSAESSDKVSKALKASKTVTPPADGKHDTVAGS